MPEQAVRIGCAQDLFEVLSSGSLGAKLAVLQDIQRVPERALRLGSHEGEDFVDFLIRTTPGLKGALRRLQTLCLLSYDDVRVTRFLCDEFARCRDAATVLHLGPRLKLSVESDFFTRFLWEEKSAQGLAAARVRAAEANLSEEERLRIAILLERDFETPTICKENLEVWINELTGRFRLKARKLAEARGQECLLFWTCWEKLPEAERTWLLQLTEEIDPLLARQTLATFLRGEVTSVEAVRAALRLGLELPKSLLDSSEPEVRAIAISQGMADHRLDEFLAQDSPIPILLAAVSRCNLEQHIELLEDHRWQVRSLALSLLTKVEERPLERVRQLAKSEAVETRTAAVELLLIWSDDAWLQENLLSD